MFERSEPVLRLICIGLAALLVYQVSMLFLHKNPLGQVSIPAVPTLPGAGGDAKGTNAVAKGTNSIAKGTNSAAKGTNIDGALKTVKGETNAPAAQDVAKDGTNAVPSVKAPGEAVAMAEVTDGTTAAVRRASSKRMTNAEGGMDLAKLGTNVVAMDATGKAKTNSAAAKKAGGTNNAAAGDLAKANGPGANGRRGGNANRPGRGPGGPGGPGLGADVPQEIKDRVERLYQSELFGTIQRPQPTMLLGIAGKEAFLSGSNGQGPVKEGGEMGNLKVLKVGTNRVLVEEDGQEKELMIFSGFGSESLMSKPKEKP